MGVEGEIYKTGGFPCLAKQLVQVRNSKTSSFACVCVTKHVSCLHPTQLNPARDTHAYLYGDMSWAYGSHLLPSTSLISETRNNLLATSTNLVSLDPLELMINPPSERNQSTTHPGTQWRVAADFNLPLFIVGHPCWESTCIRT